MKFIVNCVKELNKVAKAIIESIDEKNVICFYGKMGVGKTALIKDICSELGVKDNVSSPTFSIVNEYISFEGKPVFHFDFYRIEDEREALDLGYEEYFYKNSLCFVEWPEKIKSLIPNNVLNVKILVDKETRIIEII